MPCLVQLLITRIIVIMLHYTAVAKKLSKLVLISAVQRQKPLLAIALRFSFLLLQKKNNCDEILN